MLKGLSKNDTAITPYVATKDWTLSNVANTDVVLAENGNAVAVESVQYTFTEAIPISNCNVAVEQQSLDLARFREGLKTSGLFYPDIDQRNVDGTYKRLVHAQINTMFYNHFRDPTQIWGAERIDFDTSKTKKFLSDLIKLLDIPTGIFGDKILEGSVQVIDNTLDNSTIITDDGNSNLFAGTNLFSKQQELGNHPNFFVVGNNSGCDLYFTFNPPDAPINLEATVTGSIIFSASLSWNLPVGVVDGIVLQKSLDTGSTYFNFQFLGPVVSYTDNDVVLNGTYYYRVYAFNAIGTSSFSNTASIYINPLVGYEPWDEYSASQESNFNSGSGWTGKWAVGPSLLAEVAEEAWTRFSVGKTGSFSDNNTLYGWTGPWLVVTNSFDFMTADEPWDEYIVGQTTNFNSASGLTGAWRIQISGS